MDPDKPDHLAALRRYALALEARKYLCDTFGCPSCEDENQNDPWFICECSCHDDDE
jgi:hypothetical protein